LHSTRGRHTICVWEERGGTPITGWIALETLGEGFTPIQCANGVPTRPKVAKLGHTHEKNAYLQAHDSEVVIDGMDKTAQGGNIPEETLNQ
jgi:hypothetical protein